MSREAFPQLPPDSLAHIEDFPPELHASTQEQLLALSHIALHSEDDFGSTPVPQAELGEKHQPHIDSVAEHMERTSQLLSSAHKELGTSGTDEHEISFERLAEKAKEIAVRAAKEAKQAGDAESAVKSLESLLVIESLEAMGSAAQAEQSKAAARTIVAEGLATELVEATHETFGLVAVQKYDTIPLNALARSNSKLLRAASTLEFSEDFSDVEKSETRGEASDLSCGDLLALAKLSESEHPDTNARRDLLKQALKGATTEQVEPGALVEVLIQASRLSLSEELSVTLSDLRQRRRVGDSMFRENDMNTARLDDSIVKLIQEGETEVAKALISSSPAEADHLKRAAERDITDLAEGLETVRILEKLHKDKQAGLLHHLQGIGVSESTADWIIRTTADPDSAANIPTEFWQKLEQNYSLREILINGGYDLARSAEALSTIDSYDLAEHSALLLRKVLSIRDRDKASAYLASIRRVLDDLGELQKSGNGQSISVENVLMELANFEDPAAAVEAAETLYGTQNYLRQLRSLHDLIHPQYGNDELATFRPDDIAALVILREYCAGAGIQASYVNNISALLVSDSDPVARAKNITEGLRLANMTADTGSMLFFEIAKRDDPISLGRAVAILESQLTGISDAVRKDIIKRTVGSQSPEQTASLIVQTQKELQNQQLTIEDVGTDGLSEAMRIVENAENSKAIEVFCSNWKIQRECEEAFQKYLQQVRETGDRKAVDVERKPRIADLPEIKARFERLGISPELAEGMFESWLTYSALNRRLYNNGDIRKVATGEDVDGALAEQGKQLVKQTEALSAYVERFGVKETIALSTTFGIYNFIRYRPEQLHTQLLSWKSGEMPAKNVVVSARADWNGAVSDAGTSFERVLGEDGLFCFEVNDRVELAKVAVAIGNRERAMGREPEEVNALDNFIIDGHANPSGLLLGTRGQHLDVTDYMQEPLNGQKANTYRRHLGSNFRVILKACSTAGEIVYGKNIAEAISDHHGVRVEGSKVATEGGIIIDPDGTVRFNGGEVLSTIYA